MQIDLKIRGLGPTVELFRRMAGPQAREVYAAALTDVGFQVRRDMQTEIQQVFDRPTRFITSAPKVFPARPDRLRVIVAPTMHSENEWSKGGKVGVDPQHVLQAQHFGGRRADKRSEVALRRAGLLPAGHQTSIPKDPYPGSDDGHGNLRGSFVQQLLSYFHAFGEQGYKANMKARARKNFEGARQYNNVRTRKQHVQRDQRFFVVKDKNQLPFARMGPDGKWRRMVPPNHFAPGIWAARGTHGVDVRPVLMFVRMPNYRSRFSLDRIVARTDHAAHFEKKMRYRFRQSMGV